AKSYPRFTEPNYSANRQAVEAFGAFAASRGWTVPAAALAWVLDRDPDMIPIPGTRHAAHVGDWLAACDIAFTDADRAEIARLLPPGFAHGDRYNDAHSIGPERFC
ncbi:MAG: aldo/keto reductase, partial [Paracoccaceae bacterium]